MPQVLNYADVLERLTRAGYRSLYYNSGAFGFQAGVKTCSRGWVGPPDSSVREAARAIVRQAPEPFAEWMADAFVSICQKKLTGLVWAMPKSHWAYELDFGHRDLLFRILREINVDPEPLAILNNGSAIEFGPNDLAALKHFVHELLQGLVNSDFQLVFLDHATICTIHTRCQLWWTTTNPAIIDELDRTFLTDAKPNT